ncbi:MAG: hypothetical protein KTR30_04000 [Saprospiraceae bacterium]|nr:hypothetical protein [Saprospiraceae bacterium]
MSIVGFQLVSVCDIDSKHLKKVADEIEKTQGSRPKEYAAYQELLDKDNLQGVIIATSPHWHALQFVAACQKGLAMIKAAQKADNIVQIGFMQRSNVVGEKIRSLIKEERQAAKLLARPYRGDYKRPKA